MLINKYGVVVDQKAKDFERNLENIVREFLREYPDISQLELIALGQDLVTSVSCMVNVEVLTRAQRMKKKEREEILKRK